MPLTSVDSVPAHAFGVVRVNVGPASCPAVNAADGSTRGFANRSDAGIATGRCGLANGRRTGTAGRGRAAGRTAGFTERATCRGVTCRTGLDARLAAYRPYWSTKSMVFQA